MQVTIGGATQPLRVGLDGVPRITSRARFSTDSRYEGASIALAGSWRDDRTLAVEFDTLGLIENGTIELAFADDALRISIAERTMAGNLGEFAGRPVEGDAPKEKGR